MTESDIIRTLASPTAMLRLALRRYADRIAFLADEGPITYRTLGDKIAQFQAVLRSAGVRPNQTVVLLSLNRWDAWAAASAVSAVGAAPCWLHPLGTTATHLEQAAQVDPVAIVVDPEGFAERASDFVAAFPGLPVFTLGAAECGLDLHVAADAVGTASLVDGSSLDGRGMVGLTGGTTGKSKAVERSVAGVAAMTFATLASFDLPQQPHYLAVGPISHVTGTKILPSLIRGGKVSMMKRFDPEEVLRRLSRDRVSMMLAVPTMIYDLLDCPALDRADVSSLELLLYGASSMSAVRLQEGIDRIGPIFSQLYGQAECYPIAVLDPADHDVSRPELLSSCGFPAQGAVVALLDDAGQPVGEGEVGEICVRSQSVMRGYRGDGDATADALSGGWLHTGDLGKTDAEGRIYIVDRKKDMIVTGGFNVYPREVEDLLTAHPDVAGAAVIGVPDPRWGEAVHAVVKLRPGRELDQHGLAELIRSAKGSLLTPKSFQVIAEFPLTAAGKIDKRALAAQHNKSNNSKPTF
jgi:fatty-acyl-CoA synthase